MSHLLRSLALLCLLIFTASSSLALSESEKVTRHPLTSTEGLQLIGVEATPAEYRGKKGLRVEASVTRGETFLILEGVKMTDGVIELEIAGEPAPGSEPGSRGFVGVAFRLERERPLRYGCFYLRPTNGRAEDPVRRSHATQYVAHPDFPWHRLREESPGVFESAADIGAGEWTRVKIVIQGETARLHVNGDEKPCLVITDLKHDAGAGEVALWLHTSTRAHFRDLSVRPSG